MSAGFKAVVTCPKCGASDADPEVLSALTLHITDPLDKAVLDAAEAWMDAMALHADSGYESHRAIDAKAALYSAAEARAKARGLK